MSSMSCCIFIAFVYDIILVLCLRVEFTDNSVRHTKRHETVGSGAADILGLPHIENGNPDFGFLAERKTDTLVRGY
jgi:hypothetical protein